MSSSGRDSMDRGQIIRNIKEWSDLQAVSGYEEETGRKLTDWIQDLNCTVKVDNLYNVICEKRGTDSSRKIMIIAHLDEVGIQVICQRKENKKRYRFKTLGSVKNSNLINESICFENGATGKIYEEHHEGKDSKHTENLYIEFIGTANVCTGDVGTYVPFFESDAEWISGKALDNRVGCYILYTLLNDDIQTKNDIYYVFSTQEEIGMRGAKVAISRLMPDEIITVDLSPVNEFSSLTAGDGVGIKLSDGISVSNGDLVKKFMDIAAKHKISYQKEVSTYGTMETILINEKDCGSKNIGLSIPCFDMHSRKTRVNLRDVEAARELLWYYLHTV